MSHLDSILDYLQRMPGYPFNPDVDPDFVAELHDDFPGIDVLEQLKAWRWHHDGQPSQHFRSLRPAIRRWLASAQRHDRQPF
jgi:hypothetical protein